MKNVQYSEIAESLIKGGWFYENKESAEKVIKEFSDGTLSMILLVDIAQSLRRMRNIEFAVRCLESRLSDIQRKIKGRRCHKKHYPQAM